MEIITPPDLLSSPHWYALRTTYGREKKACDYMTAKGATVFCPTIQQTRLIDGKRRKVTVSRLPNIFFAYGTEDELKTFVYDNVNLPYLRFYYRHFHNGSKREKTPLVVPDRQMETFRIVCSADNDDVYVSPDNIHLFEHGQLVRVTHGDFTGAIGYVARFKGHHRVGIYIDGLATIATAYIPRNFLEPLEDVAEVSGLRSTLKQ